MLVLWMGYAVVVAALMVGAGAVLERRFTARRRWLSAGALSLAFLLPIARPALSRLVPVGGALDVAFGPIAPIMTLAAGTLEQAAASSVALKGLGTLVVVGWVGASLLILAAAALGVLRLLRDRRRWRSDVLDGVPVLITDGLGPAVVGLRRPDIVVPEWVYRLPTEERALILAHEEEHRRRGDPALIAAAAVLPVLMPWNPALWWGFARLRHAVEADCDARVLRQGLAGRVRYSRLLLDMGSRAAGAVPFGAGFGERASSLERRIRDMLERTKTRGWRGWAVRIGLAAVLVVAACTLEVNINAGGSEDVVEPAVPAAPEAPRVERVVIPPPTPTATEAEPENEPTNRVRRRVPPPPPVEPEAPPEKDLKAGPTFTPFTVAPSILNRSEVVRAMEAAYPPLLREAGVGGTVRVYFFINDEGQVEDTRIDRSSGHEAIDQAAINVAQVYRFSPALNKEEPVPVWVSFPITFQVR